MSNGVGLRRTGAHVAGIAWVIGAGLLTLAPALHHGLSLGSYDILSRSGLTQRSGVTVRNTVSGDQIAEMIPWLTQAWTQVHQGHIPLWNPSSGLGLPLAFNWQSAVFSLPALIGYVFPLHLAYSAQIIATLLIAGSGAYVLARTLGAGVLGCATAGTVYELSGSFMGWLGWPHAAVMSLAGWLFALVILMVRGGGHRTGRIVAFAVLFAFAVYAGEPEIFAILLASLVVFVVTLLIGKRRTERNSRRLLRPLADLSVACAAGAALSAPLALPGLQVLARSTRSNSTFLDKTEVGRSLPPHDLVHLLVQGYNGLPLAGNQVFGDAVYTDTAAYVGLIGVALAVLGVVRRGRQPEVMAFVVLGVVTLAVVYAPPIEAILLHIPLVKTVDWHRDLMTAGLCFAVVAGLGMDALVRTSTRRSTQLIVAGVLLGGLGLFVLLWLFGTSGLSQVQEGLRRDSLKWPLTTGGLALMVIVALWVWTSRSARQVGDLHEAPSGAITPNPTSRESNRQRPRYRGPSPGQVAGVSLLLLQSAFLVVSGAELWSSSANGASSTPAVRALVRAVGGATVGFGAFTCYLGPGYSTLGVLPESNILFGVHEFDFYDPILPRGYLQSWSELSKRNPAVLIYNSFCPALTTASEARRYGVKYVLEPEGGTEPTGAIFDARIGSEDLYRIPNSEDAELVRPTPTGGLPAADASGHSVAMIQPSPSTVKVTTSSSRDEILRMRLTDEPGWHATIDGRPLHLEPFAGVMLQASIPAGHHVIRLYYWPTLFTVGLIIAATSALFLLLMVVVSALRGRQSSARSL